MHLLHHPEALAIVRLEGGADPSWSWRGGPYASLTASVDETSVVCLAANVPDGLKANGPYHGFEVAGPLAFELYGIMHTLLQPLVARKISILAMSTYDTDWLLVPVDRVDEAEEALKRSGCVVTAPTLPGGDP